jgi:type VI secretion system protein ImpJ
MRQLHPVLWNKGAFLQPQHLQYQDLYLESQMSFLVDALSAYSYGFYDLTIDDAMLAKGYFSLHEASGRFKDGALFDLAHYAPDPLQIGEFPPGEDSVVVSLGIPQRRPDRNVSLPDGGPHDTRYRVEYLPLVDETTGVNEQHVQIGVQNLAYLTPRSDQTGYSVLPVARLLRTAGTLQVDRNFTPPVVRVSASPFLNAKVQEWTGLLADKSRALARTRRLRGSFTPEFTASDVQTFWLLYTVNAYHPQFAHFMGRDSVHPAEAYAHGLALAGALTSFSLDADPANLPAYEHENLGRCFSELGLVITRLLEKAIPRNFAVLPLTPVKGQRVWTTHLKDEYLKESRLLLAVETEPQQGWVIPEKWLMGTVQVVSGSEAGGLMSGQVYGLPLSRAEGSISRAFPMHQDYQYFQIETSGPTWAAICKTRTLAVYFPVPPIPPGAKEADRMEPRLELVVVFNKAV